MTSTIHFIDVDETIVEGGSDKLYPGVVEQFKAWREKGEPTYLLTCRHIDGQASDGSQAKWLDKFFEQGLLVDGWIHKPLADHYCWWDDKLLAAGHTLGKQEFPDPERGLWFSRNEVIDVLGEDAVHKLMDSRK